MYNIFMKKRPHSIIVWDVDETLGSFATFSDIFNTLDYTINQNLTYDDLVNSDEAFFTGTAVEITPITTLDKKPINQGERGNLTAQLQQKFEDIVSGNNETYKRWLTYTQ